MNELHPVGSEIKHSQHGSGVIIEHNTSVGNFHMNDFPYVVQYASGFGDYATHEEIELLK